jgi:predicted O-methyltransferase YrrM
MSKKEEILEMDGPLDHRTMEWWDRFREGPQTVDALFASNLHPLQRRREMEWMLSLAKQRTSCKTVLDIGSDKGGSTWVFARALEPLRVATVEIRGVPWLERMELMFPCVDFLGIADSSYDVDTVDAVRRWLDGKLIDVAFLDGDKCFLDKDFEAYYPFMARPSVVLFHDITDKAPLECYERVLEKYMLPHVECVNRTEALTAKGSPTYNGYEAWLRHWNGQSCGVGAVLLEWRNGQPV